MRRTCMLLLIAVFCFLVALPAAYAEPESSREQGAKLETTADAAVLMDYLSGNVLYAKNPDQELPMASVTKLMTMLLIIEEVEAGNLTLSENVAASENAAGMGGSQIYLEPGEEMSVENLLIAIATGSANDACVAMAEKISGTVEDFVERMNQRAAEMGLKHTRFVNTTGLPEENHYSSARDLALILRECLKYPLFKKVSSIYEYDLRGGEFKLWNTNKLLKWYQGVDSGKTGWTTEADYCLATSAKRDGMRLITVVLGTPEPRSHFRESMKIYDYGFSRYKMVSLVDAGVPVETVRVNKGTVENLRLMTKYQAGLVVPKEANQEYYGKVKAAKEVKAPVQKGEELGKYVVLKDGQEVTSVPLVAENTVTRASVFRQMFKVLNKMYNMNYSKTG